MGSGKVTISLFGEVPNGATADEVYDLLTRALRDAEIENWNWKETEVFDDKGNLVDSDCC